MRPVIVALDGIKQVATLLAFSRTEPYLGRALAEQWNLQICEFATLRDDTDECDIVRVLGTDNSRTLHNLPPI